MLSRKEAGGRLGLSPDSVTRLWKRGHLKGVELPRMGGKGRNVKVMFEESEIEDFKQRHKKK